MLHQQTELRSILPRLLFALMALLCLKSSMHAEVPLADIAEAQQWSTLSKWLLRDGIDVDEPQADGMTALHWAVYHNQTTIVELLIRANCNTNAATRYGSYSVSDCMHAS